MTGGGRGWPDGSFSTSVPAFFGESLHAESRLAEARRIRAIRQRNLAHALSRVDGSIALNFE
jgi:hypothetical protein